MKRYHIIYILAIVTCQACTKADLNKHEPIMQDGTQPGVVTNVKVINQPGAAIITYTLPNDDDLQYVLAAYSINNTTTRETKSSRFTDTIRVNGFSRAGVYNVTLYAVDKSENRGEPVTVPVNPVTPPYITLAATLQLTEDFGGVNVTFSNPGEEKIALEVIAKDNNNEFSPVETFYTQTINGYFSVRGYDTTARVFGAYIKDRWNNHSDTIYKTVKPIPEKMLDKSKFREYQLPNDQPSAWGWVMSALWDGKIDADYGFHTLQGATPQPHRFTFDMGVTAKVSRFKLLQRYLNNGDFFYNHGDPRYFNVWGTASTPDPSGSWNGWTKLLACESKKPSGLPLGQWTNEDMAYARGTDGLGEEFVFPVSTPPVRYIRLEIIKNWSNTDFFHAYEITFWGNPQ
jgi:hypothetical protein